MLVWNAISSMVLMILLISSAFAVISFIASRISFILSLETSTALPAALDSSSASPAFSAVSLILSEISVMVADSSCTDDACSVEPCASACAPEDTWDAPSFTWLDDTLISVSVSSSLLVMVWMESSIGR